MSNKGSSIDYLLHTRSTISKMIEDFALIDILLSDSFPKELNKSKIKDIFEILQNLERPDLAQEMKKLLLLKTNGKDGSKRDKRKANDFPLINKVLPTEILKNILKNLDYKSLCRAKQTFENWRDIIDEFKLVDHSLGKFFEVFLIKLDDLSELFLILDRISCVIVAGGYNDDPCDSVEALTEDLLEADFRKKKLPSLPREITRSSMVLVSHNKKILLCGGSRNSDRCLQLENGNWKEHSILNEERISPSVVTTNSATFLFGGYNSDDYLHTTFEYLPKDSTIWLIGKTKIPGSFWSGCAIEVKSDLEIWLIGGAGMVDEAILSFNVNDHTFQKLPYKLNTRRYGHRCAFIPNTKKLMITGGLNGISDDPLDSTEVIDIEDGTITMGSPMNSKRACHGMGVVTINNEDRLIVFGGEEFFNQRIVSNKIVDNVEVYNTETEKWETTGIKLKNKKAEFGFLTVNLAQIQNL